MPNIGDAPNGEDTSADGTEKIPVSGSKWMLLSTVASYIQNLPAVATALGLTTQGDILYRNASGLARLAAGTAGHALRTLGAAANPAWQENGYSLQLYGQSFSPADSTTYYFGALVVVPSTTADQKRVYIQRAGVVSRADIVVHNNGGTQGSNETSTMSLRLNNTSDTTLTASFDTNDASGNSSVFTNTSLSITVAAGDYFEVKWVTPAWATNPTNVCIDVRIYIR